MRNLTLAMDDEILREARKLALDDNTTINQLVREYLKELVETRGRRSSARARIKQSMREKRVAVGPRTWSREDLHER